MKSININGNTIVTEDFVSFHDLLSDRYLKLDKYDCSIRVNKKSISYKDYENNIPDKSSIDIDINARKLQNLSVFKKYLNNIFLFLKEVKRYFNTFF